MPYPVQNADGTILRIYTASYLSDRVRRPQFILPIHSSVLQSVKNILNTPNRADLGIPSQADSARESIKSTYINSDMISLPFERRLAEINQDRSSAPTAEFVRFVHVPEPVLGELASAAATREDNVFRARVD